MTSLYSVIKLDSSIDTILSLGNNNLNLIPNFVSTNFTIGHYLIMLLFAREGVEPSRTFVQIHF